MEEKESLIHRQYRVKIITVYDEFLGANVTQWDIPEELKGYTISCSKINPEMDECVIDAFVPEDVAQTVETLEEQAKLETEIIEGEREKKILEVINTKSR